MSSVVSLSAGASEAQIQNALNGLADGGTLVLAANQTVMISSGLIMDVTSRSITLDLNGSTLQQAGDVTVLTVRGSHAAGQGGVLGHDAAGHLTVTTPGTSPAASIGDWVKVFSDSFLPNDQGGTTRLGQAMEVVGVEGNKLILKGELADEELYVTNIRVSKFLGGTPAVENGTVRGDQGNPAWIKDLITVRSAVDADLNHLTVRDGNSMGINIIDSVNAKISQAAVINLTDNPSIGQNGYAVHSASSFGTTVQGLYAEQVRHATDNNAVGTGANTLDPSKYGADIGMNVSDVVAMATKAFAFSWHTEGRLSSVTDSVVFNSFGVLGARGVHNAMSDVAGYGNTRGIQFYEYGDGDGRNITVDNVQLRATTYYAYTSIGDTANNAVSNSTFDVFDKKIWISTGITPINTTINVLAAGAQNKAMAIGGTAFDDRLIGGGGADTVAGGDGADYLWGGLGADHLNGGAGRDRFAYLSIAEGGDVIGGFTSGIYGDAIDLSVIAIQNGWRGDVFANGYVSLVQSGADTLVRVDANGGGNLYVTLATLQNVDAVAARANISTDIHVTGTVAITPDADDPPPPPPPPDDFPGALRLGVVNGLLNGTSASETLIGTSGNDTLLGNEGDDTLMGGAGRDTLNGGPGINVASYGTASAGVTVDLVTASLSTGDAAGDSYLQIARYEGSPFGDNFYGSTGANTIGGGGGDDLIDGRSGSDRLYGGDGGDRLYGGTENDGLFGEAGADRLVGGAGYDTLTGGAGGDAFVLDFADKQWEVIADFVPGEDKIALVNFAISSFSIGSFVSSTAPRATAAVGTILYDTDDGILSWDADGTGAGYSVKLAVLTGDPVLGTSDFLFS